MFVSLLRLLMNALEYGDGSYSVVYDGQQVASGADFGKSESTTFGSCERLTSSPTISVSFVTLFNCMGKRSSELTSSSAYPSPNKRCPLTITMLNRHNGARDQSCHG